MSIQLNFFPVLTQDLFEKIGYELGLFELSYTSGGFSNALDAVPADSTGRNSQLQVRDEKNVWEPDGFNLCVKRSYTINVPKFLFGENGIAGGEDEIGIALLWTSKASNQRGIHIIADFNSKTPFPYTFNLNKEFPAGQLKGSISLQTVLYMKTTGIREPNEIHLANKAGIILGVLDEYTLVIDGNGSVFPIVEVSEPSQPLWWVNCQWNDPTEDAFDEESVRICINKAHANYKIIKMEGGLKESPLLLDIIASALQIIIQKVRESDYWEEIKKGEDLEPGSIGQAVNYFITTFNWDVHSPESLALSIRKDFDNRI
ncbi:hypothetical protein AB685_16960 [Bacillus sp. LL01]|uniref:hypothetical protein n=1 Tax=Bacillus sp. LL01 TaxID=1665556 RepID=UPI00064D0CD1|nr:hypothetical protein [Bacillus sp. LL01]KMJ57114.1 hypothetical protein AB685_16960 [Bacillus sp. LL01]